MDTTDSSITVPLTPIPAHCWHTLPTYLSIYIFLIRFYTGSNMCELLPQYTMHLLALAGHCHIIEKGYVSIHISKYVAVHMWGIWGVSWCVWTHDWNQCGVWVPSGLGLEPEVEWYWDLPETLTLGSVPLWGRPTYVAISWKKNGYVSASGTRTRCGEKNPPETAGHSFRIFFPKYDYFG